MQRNNTYIYLSIFIAVLVSSSGSIGIFFPAVYEKEAFEWQVQAVWQDYIDVLLIVPIMLLSGIFSSYRKALAESVWSGTLLYLIYSYTIYTFDIHFNELFYFYCLILCLSFYSLLWYFIEKLRTEPRYVVHRSLITAIYFILFGTVWYFVWLGDITPAILLGKTPLQLEKFELPTNPVYVIDLSIILPAYIITGIMMYIKSGPWQLFAPPLLVFGALMGITIGSLEFLLFTRGYGGSYIITIVMAALTLINVISLIKILRLNKIIDHPTAGFRGTTAGF